MRSSFKLYIIILLLSILLVFTIFNLFNGSEGGIFSARTKTTNNMILENVKKLGRLELVRLDIRDIVETVKDNQILPDEKVLLVVYGEVTAGIDFERLTEKSIRVNKEDITITLPQPEIFSTKVDHEKSHVYDTKMGFISTGGIISAELIDKAYKSAEGTMAERAREMNYQSVSKENAKKLLTPLLEKVGGKKVIFQFE